MYIAVDVFGGDHAPQAVLDGCKQALEQNQSLQLLLFGDEVVIAPYIKENGLDPSRAVVRHAPEVIAVEAQPTVAIKKQKNSSLVQALMAVAQGEAQCMVSAGSSGAVLAGATLIVRRISGVKRPALAPFLPTRTGGSVLLLDCGANTDCKPSYLQQFAVMGAKYVEATQGVQNPRVGLLNNGAEEGKGNALTKAAYPLLAAAPVNFVGNCEARDALTGAFDVVVSDGFDGNILLKSTEGAAALMMGMLKEELLRGKRTKLGAALAKPAFSRLKVKMDYTEYGGALLLGINGGVIKAHGSSNAKAIAAAIRQAHQYGAQNVTKLVEEAVAALGVVEDE
ncbi:phosphate acyltransferase PlsX [Christensenellaceae bacterium OttesenSCG-928-L17]|nr:phosphate acyltransferase PlsX [Christensenellaceae bacterium OttesenSCG-928-L17]